MQKILSRGYSKFKRTYRTASVYSEALYQGIRHKQLFQGVKQYCMFIGYPRSGHSLIGSLLDAHPHAVIAHELDALTYFQRGFSKEQVYYLLLEKSRTYTKMGRAGLGHNREVCYSYQVPNQWQGKFETLQVIGDKKGGSSTARFRTDPEFLQRLQKTIETPIKVVHVTRNPFDNISSIFQRRSKTGFSLQDSVDYYFSLCETIATMKQQIEKTQLIDIQHEAAIASPQTTLRQLCAFMELDGSDSYLNDCASIVFKSPRQTRSQVEWDTSLIQRIEQNINKYPFLEGYSYEG